MILGTRRKETEADMTSVSYYYSKDQRYQRFCFIRLIRQGGYLQGVFYKL